MAHNIHYHSKREEGSIERKYWTKARLKPAGHTPNSASLCLMSNCSSDLQCLSALLTAAHFCLLGWFHALLAALLSRFPMALAFPTSWNLQGNPGFSFTASCNGFSRPPSGTALAQARPQQLFLVIP